MPNDERNIGEELAAAERAVLISPAGYGKTHAVALAAKIAAETQGRQLILTHTNAGVHSLRARLKKQKVPSALWNVETIAGWSLKYAASFRKLSGIEVTPTGGGWEAVYPAALGCLRVPAIQNVLLQSYKGLFVDEYQDCNPAQHALIMHLADLLPCRILGDPLQAIFRFAGGSVDFDADLSSFQQLAPLDIPYRWINHGNNELAEWLHDVRRRIIAGEQVRINGPVKFLAPGKGALSRHAFSLLGNGTTVVVAHRFAGQAHHFARSMGGRYKSMEEMDCQDLLQLARSLDGANPNRYIISVLEFAGQAISNLSSTIAPFKSSVEKGDFQPRRFRSHPNLADHISEMLSGHELHAHSAAVLNYLQQIHGANTYRRELVREAVRVFQSMASGGFESHEQCFLAVRERTRKFGRPAEMLSSSRILLIKGLEFDHAIVPNADALSPEELYVALTRGTNSLAVEASGVDIRTT